MYCDSTVEWVIAIISSLMLIPKLPYAPWIISRPKKTELDEELKGVFPELFFQSHKDFYEFVHPSKVSRLLYMYLYLQNSIL